MLPIEAEPISYHDPMPRSIRLSKLKSSVHDASISKASPQISKVVTFEELLMKRTQILILCLLPLALSVFCSASPESESVDQLQKKIQEQLPDAWSVNYKKKTSWLEVCRNEKVLTRSMRPNTDPFAPATLTEYAFAFRIKEKTSGEDYHIASRKNQQILDQSRKLYDQLIARGVSHKFDSFIPDTDSDRALVARYEELMQSRVDLPQFYFQKISLSWAYNDPSNNYISVSDKQIRSECDKVQNDVIKLLTRYKDLGEGGE